MHIELIRCDPSGVPVMPVGDLPEPIAANCRLSADLYRRVGYVEPWVSYVAVEGGVALGGGAFVGPPHEGCVEIAYFTLPPHEGRGIAGQIATRLVAIARASDPSIGLKAFTLMEENPSVRILRRLGFVQTGTARDPDAGEVWEWRA
ncbi:MAG: N-acetyltransferase [Proteobacteria bacterium]|nr:MAG: N-acetyltransferase [Pseudomonadota bacterium]